MSKENKSSIDELFSLAVQNQRNNNLQVSKNLYKKIIKLNPKFIKAYNNLGLIFQKMGENENALRCYEKVIQVNPDLANVQYNMGLIFEQLDENEKAKKCYEKVIEINPNIVNAHNNLGLVFKKLGENEKAKKCYEKAIEINPNYANVHNNLGIFYADLGKYNEAINSYIVALKCDNEHKSAKENLISSLTYFKSDSNHPIIVANNNLQKVQNNFDLQDCLKNENLAIIFKRSYEILNDVVESIKGIEYIETQTYRRNSINLNCRRHHKVFNQYNIIPRFCFSCFKIQIEPKNIIELIKLFFVFDSFKFSNNNWRKCMIELRPNVSGVYKGLIYCSSMEEASEILSDISPILKKILEYKVSIKRGCSEFYKPFPNFKQTDKKESTFMNYNNKWEKLEKIADTKKGLIQKKLSDSISGLSISDFLIMNHWLNYAKLINDLSYKDVSINFPYSKFIFEKISSQIEFRRKEFLC